MNFEVLLLIAKVFSANFRGVASFSDTREHFTNFFFSTKNFHQFTKVFPIIRYRFDPPQQCESFSTYLLYTQVHLPPELEWWAIINPGGKYLVRLNLNGTRRKVYIGMCI